MAFAWSSRRWSCPSRHWNRFSRLLALLALLLAAPAAYPQLPDKFSARYEVHHLGMALGEAVVRYEQLDDAHYRYSSETRPIGLSTLFVNSEIHEVSEGRITDDGYRPDRYVYERRGSKAKDAELLFDWEALKVRNEVEGKPWEMPIPADTLDRMVSQLQLMWDLAAQEKDLTYHVADGGKLRTFKLQVLGRETLNTPYGKLDTIKIARQNDDDRRATTFWCAPALNYLAVRIDHREKRDNYSMTLQKLSGFAVKKVR